MNLTRCKKGHYYDGDKYAECPHCAQMENDAGNTVRMADKVDTEQTSQKRGVQGKALKDAVLEALEKKRENEMKLPYIQRDEGFHLYPVGVLVVISGSLKGKVYVLGMGCNYIGDGEDGLMVDSDMEQLSEPVASLTYHEERRIFVLKSLSEEPAVQVGRMMLRDSIMLCAYDKVVIKDEVLLFVPICGEHFRWESESFLDNI